MRNLLLASAAVIAVLGTASIEAKADYWTTLNVNKGLVDGDLWIHDFSATRNSKIGTANIGALTLNENEENIKVRVKGPVVEINVDQKAKNENDQGAYVRNGNMSNRQGGQIAAAGAGALALGGGYYHNPTGAVAGAAAGNLDLSSQENEVKTYDNDRNRQFAGNLAIIHVEDPFGGLIDCGCSTDDYYTANINYGTVSGDIHAGDFSLSRGSSLTAANIGAATMNSSVNNMSVKVNNGHRR